MPSPIDDRSDHQLIEASLAGEVTAFGELVRRHQRAAVRVAAMALGETTNADDVAQEAFVKAFHALHRFRPGAPFGPWLYRIVTNTARNWQRSQTRQRALALRSVERAPIGEPPADELVLHRSEASRVVAALGRLAPADRLILTYRWYEELTEREIAEALGCRPGTVKSRLSRAMARLRTALESA